MGPGKNVWSTQKYRNQTQCGACRTPHAPDAAGAARKLGVFYHPLFVLLPLPITTGASGAGDGAVRQQIIKV
jgi:hypothetical protein